MKDKKEDVDWKKFQSEIEYLKAKREAKAGPKKTFNDQALREGVIK